MCVSSQNIYVLLRFLKENLNNIFVLGSRPMSEQNHNLKHKAGLEYVYYTTLKKYYRTNMICRISCLTLG